MALLAWNVGSLVGSFGHFLLPAQVAKTESLEILRTTIVVDIALIPVVALAVSWAHARVADSRSDSPQTAISVLMGLITPFLLSAGFCIGSIAQLGGRLWLTPGELSIPLALTVGGFLLLGFVVVFVHGPPKVFRLTR